MSFLMVARRSLSLAEDPLEMYQVPVLLISYNKRKAVIGQWWSVMLLCKHVMYYIVSSMHVEWDVGNAVTSSKSWL